MDMFHSKKEKSFLYLAHFNIKVKILAEGERKYWLFSYNLESQDGFGETVLPEEHQ